MGSPPAPGAATQTAPAEDIASCCIMDLDDASLCAVFSWLDAQELATVALCCQRFSTVSRGNPLWLQLLSRDFGLSLTSTASAGAAAAFGLYRQLLQGKQRQRALPCRAVCTDGGCDAPADSTYWADNMFRHTVGELYCSDAATSNVHVAGRLLPNPAVSVGARREGPLPELGQTPEALRQFIFDRCLCTAKELIPADTLSSSSPVSTSSRGTQAAQAADTPAAAAAATEGAAGTGAGSEAGPSSSSQQQQAGSSSSAGGGGGGGFQGMLGFWWAQGKTSVGAVSRAQWQLEQRRLAAAAALESCSTRGLCDLFAESYHACQQGSNWALGLFKGLTTNGDVHKMHVLMFALWSEHASGRNGDLTLRRWPLPQRLQQLPPPPLPAGSSVGAGRGSVQQQAGPQAHASPAAGAGAAGHGQQQQQQQPKRELLCDEEQLLLLEDASLADSSSLVQEVWVARGKASTCPLSTGVIYLGCQQQQQQHQQQQTPSLAAAAAAGAGGGSSSSSSADNSSGGAPTAAASAATDASAGLSQQLGQALQQPWISATDGLNSAAAVFAAAEAGQLPAVLDYAASSSAEWIEFERPTWAELLQQQQQHRSSAAAGSSSSGSSQLSEVVFFPVLWFRFKSGLADQQGLGLMPGEGGGEEEGEEEEEDDSEVHSDYSSESVGDDAGDQAAAAAAAGQAAAAAAQPPAEGVVLAAGAWPGAAAAGAGAADETEMAHEQEWQEFGHLVHAAFEHQQQLAVQQQQQQQAAEQAAAGQQAEAAGDGAGGVPVGVGTGTQGQHQQGPASASAAASDPTATAGGGDGAPVPRQASPWPVCAAHPALPGAAPEAAAALGWYPSQQQHMSLAVRLQRPRLAQLLCVKLVDSEDCSPEFNASRGGCNVDCESVMVRGQDLVGVVPQGVVLAGAACL